MIRLAIVEDHPAIAEGLGALLRDEPDIEVVASVADGAAAERAIVAMHPDVVLCDLLLGDGSDGFDLMERMVPGPRFVILSAYSLPSYYRRAMDAGVAGFVSKTAPVEVIVGAIRTAASGGTTFTKEARHAARSALQRPSGREGEIVRLVAEGLSNAEIAERLGLRLKTVESQLRRLFDRYDVASRTRLVRVAEQQGWLGLDP